MSKIEFYNEFKIDKDPRIVEEIITLYWKTFIEKNKKSKELVFIRRSELVKNSKYNRRNCYKHIKHLLLTNIFVEEENFLVPSSIIYKINTKIINPTEIIFNTKITKENIDKDPIEIGSEISLIKTKELSKLIILGNHKLYDFITIPFNIGEKISFSTSFKIDCSPKSTIYVDTWNQKDKGIAENEKILLKTLSPYKDPLGHNALIKIRGGNETPLFEIEKDKKTYVIAGGSYTYSSGEGFERIVGDFIDKKFNDSKIIFYDKYKNIIGEKNIVFPSSKEKGIPLADTSPLVFTRKDYRNLNPNYIGYYDFKNGGIESKYFVSYVIIHFAKFEVPKGTCFIKICSGKNSTIAIASIFPLEKLNVKFIKERMSNLNSGKFIQDKFGPLTNFCENYLEKEKFKRINDLLKESSFNFSEKKQRLLKKALIQLFDYSAMLKKKVLEDIKRGRDVRLIPKILFSTNRSVSYIYGCLDKIECELKEKSHLIIKDNEKFYDKIIPLLINKLNPENLSLLLFAKYLNLFALYKIKDYSSLDKTLEDFKKNHLNLIKDRRALGIIDRFLPVLKRKIQDELFSKKTQKYLNEILWLNNQLINFYNEAALKTIEFEDKKDFNKEYIINKYKFYETLSIYYQYQNILYKTEYYEKTSEEKEKFEDLKLMLEKFKEKIL